MKFLFENLESVSNWGDILQMGVLELIRKVRGTPALGWMHPSVNNCL